MHCPTMLVAPFCTIASPIQTKLLSTKHIKEKNTKTRDMLVPGFKVMKSSSILKAVKGLTVIVAAYSMGDSLLILCQTLRSFTT